MRSEIRILAASILFLIAASATAAESAKGEAKDAGRVATGTVAAVTAATRTLVVESTLGGQPWILGVVVPDGLAVTIGGKAKQLEDLKAGERVRLRWIREQDRLVAESIEVVAAKAP